MTETNASGSVISDHLGALAAAALVGAVVATVVVVLLGPLEPLVGDEPPIRVRNGSVDLQIGGAWESVGGDKKDWKVKGEPVRDGNDYEVIVGGATPTECPSTTAMGNPVTFTVKEGNNVVGSIVVRATGNKTRVRSEKDLAQKLDQLISQEGDALYISAIAVGSGGPLCTFTAKNTNLRVALLDP